LLRRMMPMIEVWVKRAVRERKSQALCVLWAHLAYIFKNIDLSALDADLCEVAAMTILSAQIFLTATYQFDVEPPLVQGRRWVGGEGWREGAWGVGWWWF
jgi:hypothetical protein